MSKSLEKIQSLKQEIQKESEKAKTEMAKDFNNLMAKHKELVEAGITPSFLKEPQFHEYTNYFGMVVDGSPTTSTKKARSGSRTDWTDTILNLLKSGPKTAKEINEACGGTQQAVKLAKLVQAKKIKKEGKGKGNVKFLLA